MHCRICRLASNQYDQQGYDCHFPYIRHADTLTPPQHPDTHLLICLSAWRLSATLYPDMKRFLTKLQQLKQFVGRYHICKFVFQTCQCRKMHKLRVIFLTIDAYFVESRSCIRNQKCIETVIASHSSCC